MNKSSMVGYWTIFFLIFQVGPKGLAQFNAAITGISQFEFAEITGGMRVGNNFLNQDVFEINVQNTLDAFRVRSKGSTKFRIFNNGAISLLSNWGDPQPNELHINGNTGILMDNPGHPLHVNGTVRFEDNVNNGGILFSSNTGGLINGSSISIDDLNGDTKAWIGAGSLLVDYGFLVLRDDQGNDRVILRGEGNLENDAGYMELRTGSDPGIVLDANYGNSGFARVATDELEIKGGADLVEYFDINNNQNEKPRPGMLVSIDPNHTGLLSVSNSKNDKNVIGVISGAMDVRPGIVLKMENTDLDGEYPVAIAGRVYVKANNSNGPIQPGDLLTSSNVPGQACRVRKIKKSQGAIIGKALSAIDEPEGFVLVLINLQ